MDDSAMAITCLIIVVRGIDTCKAPFINVAHMSPCSYIDLDAYYIISSILGLNPLAYRELYAAADASNSSTAALAGDGVDFALGSAGAFDTILAFTKTGD
ncbi:unnamed protein product [Sphagnum balticum]